MADFNTTKSSFARETLTVSNTVKQLTPSVYQTTVTGFTQSGGKFVRAHGAIVRVETGGATTGIRYTLDGTTPVAATTGELAVNTGTTIAPVTTPIVLQSFKAIQDFKMIRDQATDTVVQVEYFR